MTTGTAKFVREVRHKLPGATLQRHSPVDAESVAGQDADVRSERPHGLLQGGDQRTVQLHRGDLRARPGQRDRQRPESRSDLDHLVAPLHAGQLHDAAGQGRFDQEMLAERL